MERGAGKGIFAGKMQKFTQMFQTHITPQAGIMLILHYVDYGGRLVRFIWVGGGGQAVSTSSTCVRGALAVWCAG